MNTRRVEIYFVLYLTAIISFFAVNRLVKDWKVKEENRRNELVAVIKSIVEIGDVFTWIVSAPERMSLTPRFALNPFFKVESPFELTAAVRPADSAGSILDERSLVFRPGTSDTAFSSFQLKPGDYSIFMVVVKPGRVKLSESGLAYIRQKLNEASSALPEINDLVQTIAENLESMDFASDTIPYFENIFVPHGRVTNGGGEKVIYGKASVIAGVSGAITFRYNFDRKTASKLQFYINNAKAEVVRISSDEITLQCPANLSKGNTYTLRIKGSGDVNTDHAVVRAGTVKLDMEDIACLGSTVRGEILTEGIEVGDLRWKTSWDNFTTHYGQRILFGPVRNEGLILVRVFSDDDKLLIEKTILASKPPKPVIKLLKDNYPKWTFSVSTSCPGNSFTLEQYDGVIISSKPAQGTRSGEITTTLEVDRLEKQNYLLVRIIVRDKYGQEAKYEERIDKRSR